MVQKLKSLIKKYIPKRVLNLRHWFFALVGALYYRNPSNELLVIGVTGTSGKSTTIFLLRTALEAAGYRVGSLSTIDFYIAGENKLNDQKMTMLGKMKTQKYLREMVDKNCDIAIVETTSEGAVQYRHTFINYDFMILTNLYPEHIESHGSFENYKQAKLSIFKHVGKSRRKKLGNSEEPVPKIALVNGDSIHAPDFLNAGKFDRRYAFGRGERMVEDIEQYFTISEVRSESTGISFSFNTTRVAPHIYGVHNAENCAIALCILSILGVSSEKIRDITLRLENAPGRTEFIHEAEPHGFQVIVDYAFEPKAIEALYSIVSELSPKRIIHVFGSTGGGRDKSRRFSVGEYVGRHADIVVVTDEDPYDDDPLEIMRDVSGAVEKKGKVPGKNLFIIEDRREAVERAVAMAESGDIVLVTGKGSEQGMCIAGGRMILWDDREVVRSALALRVSDEEESKKEIKTLWSK